jgi:hypothetical protein
MRMLATFLLGEEEKMLSLSICCCPNKKYALKSLQIALKR